MQRVIVSRHYRPRSVSPISRFAWTRMMSSQASGQRKIMGNGDKSVTNNAHPRQHHKHNVNKQPQPCIDATLQLGAGCEAISAALMKLVPAARIINVQLVEPAERQATAGGFYLDVSVPDGDRHLIQLAALQEQVRAYASTRSPAVELLQVSVVVTGDKANEVSNHVIRLHAIAFNTSAQLTAWHQHRAEVLARDHRHIGAQQQLFMMDHRYAPGSLFVLPHGQHIVSRLKTLLRDEYRRLGYEEISTPLLYHTDLWMRSGHLENYKDDMFLVEGKRHGASVDGHTASHTFGLKPMSCPAHCLVYGSAPRKHCDLPLRLADFTALHRNERSGALSGLTRLRQFHQDDGHIFCRADQLDEEISSTLGMVRRLYRDVFGFPKYSLALSTRPQKFMGDPLVWEKAEEILKGVLNVHTKEHGLNEHALHEGDGAFYGPKIDITVTDSTGRKHQTATIQLDFQLPERFDLTYTGADMNAHRPILIHRAVLGSLERFWALWMEECRGRWPFWASPRQCRVVPVVADVHSTEGKAVLAYAQEVAVELRGDQRDHTEAYRVTLDGDHDETLAKRVRAAQLLQYNFVAVIGEREYRTKTVSVRDRDTNRSEVVHVRDLLKRWHDLQRVCFASDLRG